MPKKLKTFSLKIHKGAGIFKNHQNLSKWNIKKIYIKGLNSENKNKNIIN